jgi:D-alanine-D-alanine ligase
VLLLCGGQSEEHEVSLSSARSIISATRDRLDVTPLVIDRGGRLLPPAESLAALADGSAPAGSGQLQLSQFTTLDTAFDVVFPVLHGPNGEDGTVQGLLSLMGLPFVGSDVLGSAVSMDKLMMKYVFAAHGLPQVRYAGLNRSEWLQNGPESLHGLKLRWPLFVKPANLGSSVGISRVTDQAGLVAALDLAFGFDRRVIIEEAVVARELEIAVLGNDRPEVSPVGEVTFESAFYDYATKYETGQAQLLIPADVPADVAERCAELALSAFRAVDAAGLARIDFFYEEAGGRLLLNEINTMPGFTTTSMYPRLWQAAGVSYAELVTRLVQLALERSEDAAVADRGSATARQILDPG